MSRRVTTRCHITSSRVSKPVTLAVVSDLHNGRFDDSLETIRKADAVLIPGDVVNRHRHGMANTVSFLLAIEDRPVFFSRGNHELLSPEGEPAIQLIRRLGMTVVDDGVFRFGEIVMTGQPAEWTFPEKQAGKVLEKEEGFRLVLCHHPEYYEKLVRDCDIDLCIAGHAHGGQVQIAGHGLYAPGQGILPKYTHGFYDGGKLLVSRGFTNSALAPRIGNPCELILLTIAPEGAKADEM